MTPGGSVVQAAPLPHHLGIPAVAEPVWAPWPVSELLTPQASHVHLHLRFLAPSSFTPPGLLPTSGMPFCQDPRAPDYTEL